jgi:hypothetical protein
MSAALNIGVTSVAGQASSLEKWDLPCGPVAVTTLRTTGDVIVISPKKVGAVPLTS